ncbi:ABC transporter substrate-binding protein [Mycolicibacterium sp.]|uniref:ABC transporter substrate-binding protein n=1 Tax=Mycolicibacterium sp. TaxID=2320850 RepID=UPI001A184D85|nr:ABC transporter substrate-binding protein [Mycolicibacterium sp.]MBJ7399680.1 ABC transporter substrate-binding protein [Mycolicibacterium sp.]
MAYRPARLVTVILFVLGLLLPAGVPAGAAPAKSVFTVGVTQDVDSLNPFVGVTAAAYEIFQMVYPTLTEYGAKDFSIQPGLAESWTESPDKTFWTYKIRPGLKWSDGVPLTAKDAAYTFNRIINGTFEKVNYGSYVGNITKAEAPDDTTLILRVDKPSPIMEKLAVYILPEHVYSTIDETAIQSFKDEPTDGKPVVGAGPYLTAERQVGQFTRMVANPDFYRGKPAVDEVVFKFYANPDALGQALRKGEIDYADGMEANVFDSLADVPNIKRLSAVYSGFNELAFNTGAATVDNKPIGDGNPLLKDKRLREAIGWSIDRKALVEKVLGGHGSVGSTLIPPMYADWHLSPPNEVSYDPDKARALLDAAGYPVGPNGIRQDATGAPLKFRLFGRSDKAASKKAVEFIKNYLADIGVETTVTLIAEDALTEKIGQGEYDMFEWGWVVEPDPDYQLSTFTCDKRSYEDGGSIVANLSDSFYCNPEYDALFTAQSTETDPAKRIEIVKQMQQILYDDWPYAITYYYDNLVAYRSDRFEGFIPQPAPDGSYLFQYGTWTYENLKPVQAADSGQASSGSSPAMIGGIVAAVALLGGLTMLLLRRRRTAGADDRE